jgi:hypothetical protein
MELIDRGLVDQLQGLLLLTGWVTAFMLGRELQLGFSEWRRVGGK